MGAHGWVAGIASHGSVSLSRGWLISVEAPRHPGHLSSIQLDAVVNRLYCCFVTYCAAKLIATCSLMIGQFVDTMMLASTSIEWS